MCFWPQASFTDPANRGLDPNAMHGGGIVNAHAMPTCCITGMAPMGLTGALWNEYGEWF